MSNRRSLGTGGGFIRSHLVRQLLEKGDTVRVPELPEYPSCLQMWKRFVAQFVMLCGS